MVLVLTLVVGGIIQLLLLNSYEAYTCRKVYVSDGCCCIESGSYAEELWKVIRGKFKALDSVLSFIGERIDGLLQIVVLILWGIGLFYLFFSFVEPKVSSEITSKLVENIDKSIREYFDGSAIKGKQHHDASEESIVTDTERNRKGLVDTIEASIYKAFGVRVDLNGNGNGVY